MTSLKHLHLEDCPDSVYAGELRRGLNGLRFEPALEDEFVKLHLQHNRFRIRIWWYTAIILVPAFALLRMNELNLWSGELLFRMALMVLLIHAVSLT